MATEIEISPVGAAFSTVGDYGDWIGYENNNYWHNGNNWFLLVWYGSVCCPKVQEKWMMAGWNAKTVTEVPGKAAL